MARPARPWFRFYVEAFSDRKLLRLTPAQRWLWVAVLGAARDSCEPGRLMISEGEPMTAAELARFADVPVDDVWPALEQMRRYGMVVWDEAGRISVCNWDSRQFESDNTAVRTAKHRSKERSYEQSNDVPGNGPDTETDTEAERERCKRRPTDSFELDDTIRAWAAEKTPGLDLEREREAWLLWCEAEGRTYANPRAGFQTWCRRSWEQSERRSVQFNRPQPDPVRPVLGRGVDAPKTWELDADGNAHPVAP